MIWNIRCIGSQLILAIWLTLFLMGCGGAGNDEELPGEPATDPPGNFSISASVQTEPATTDSHEILERYLDAFVLAQLAGANGQFSSYTWSELEPSSGDYELQNFSDTMAHAEDENLTVLVGLQVINMVARAVPSDLVNQAWNSATMISRMHALLDQLIPLMQGRVAFISIGNEVDGYFTGIYASELSAYTSFYADAVDYLHTHFPGVAVGVTITSDALLGVDAMTWYDLNRYSDVVIATYYPLQPDFTVRPSNRPLSDFPALIQFAAGKPLVLQEVGYPASTVLGSSEASQAEFVSHVFTAWVDSDGAIPFLNLFLLHDLSDGLVDTLVGYYGVSGDNFREYLATLGLRYADSVEKEAWRALLDAASDAGLR